MNWPYTLLAGAAAGAVLLLLHRLYRAAPPLLDETGEPLPLTALQRRSWLALALGLVASIAFVAVLWSGGLELYDRSAGVRLAVYALLGVGVAVHSLVVPRTLRGELRSWIDERDLRILERAPAVQGLAVLVVLAGWAIGLTETYMSSGAIPIVFPSLIFLSALLVHNVSISLAVLLGYRRALRDAQA